MILAGVMTGTSVDGIDVALVEFKSETDWKLIDAKEKSFHFWYYLFQYKIEENLKSWLFPKKHRYESFKEVSFLYRLFEVESVYRFISQFNVIKFQ